MSTAAASQTTETLGAFDYVIIGAGSAGCVMAEALTRDGTATVALIEAGGSDRKFFVQMPLGYGKTFYDTTINWNYRAEPDPGLAGQSDFWPRGKLLGGSGSINAMVWIRGDASDYDGWAAEGNPGWSYRDVLPVFKALEDNAAGGSEWRGRGGPMHITDVSGVQHPLADRFINAGLAAGFRFNPDFNDPDQEGMGSYQITTKGGWRMSAAKAFLRPALKRRNLCLFTQAQATRLLTDAGRITGVELVRGNRPGRIEARAQVILTAGAVNTPHLLQLSGIGPGAHLRSLGIPVVLDSPAVGHHLQDHLGINYTYRATIPTLNTVLRPWWGKVIAGLQFLLAGSGPLSMSLNQGGGFVRSRPDLARPDIQLYVQAISTLTGRTGTRPLLRPDPFPGFCLGLSTCRPQSRGSILARSPDPFAAPAIHANAYGTPADVETMLAGVKLIRRLASQPALAGIIAEELSPGPAVVSDDALIDDFRHRSGTVYHPVGTARMGTHIDGAAVDHRLRLHGLAGLRIADASVFPAIVSGNTNAPTMMVAARAAAMIIEDGR